MPKAPKAKVSQQKKLIHPNSRAAGTLQKQAARDHRILKVKSDSTLKMDLIRQKLQWFQDNMDQNKTSYTKHELALLTKQYMDRFAEEEEQINIIKSVGNRQSKQHVSRETAIKLTKERELAEFTGVGIEVPDLVNGKHLETFRNWTGEIKYFPNLKMRRAKDSDIQKEEEVLDSAEGQNEQQLPDYIEDTEN